MCMRTTSPQEFHPQHQELHINHVWLINKYATTKSKDNLKLKLRTIFCREKGSNRLEIDGPNISRWYKYPGINEREREGGPGGEVGLKMKREKIKIMTQVRRKIPFKQNATLKDYNLKLQVCIFKLNSHKGNNGLNEVNRWNMLAKINSHCQIEKIKIRTWKKNLQYIKLWFVLNVESSVEFKAHWT